MRVRVSSVDNGKQYGAILADPPWRFRTWSETNQKKSASRHYSLMHTDEISALPVLGWAAKDCVLFMWTLNSMQPQAHEVIKSWGFTYKTVAFTWVKTGRLGMGYWTRQNSERCLLATRGKPKRLNADVREIITAPRREHSRKPDEQYERIERLVDGPYLEMFARPPHRTGWDVWGNEAVASS